MNRGTYSPVDPPGLRLGGDELGEVLQTFFQSEMPHPWPAFALPAAPPSRRQQLRRWFTSTRLALAASIALLLIGSLAIPMADRGAEQPELNNTSASTKNSPYRVRESLLQEGDNPTEYRIEIIPRN
jgi:hypothetical protein